MRRPVLLPALATTVVVALTVAGCTSASTTKRTVTVVNTVTSSAASASKPPSSVVVVSSTAPASSAPATTAAKPTPPPATTTKPTQAAIVKVDPLKADCAVLLDPSDIKKAIGATVGTATNRIRLGAAERGVTGAVRCLYGSPDRGKTAPVRIRLTQYNSAAAAKTQFNVDVQTAEDAGASISDVTVNGYPAKLMLQNGGVVEMVYGTWTMSVAASDKLATNAELSKGLPILAGQALTRIIKNS